MRFPSNINYFGVHSNVSIHWLAGTSDIGVINFAREKIVSHSQPRTLAHLHFQLSRFLSIMNVLRASLLDWQQLFIWSIYIVIRIFVINTVGCRQTLARRAIMEARVWIFKVRSLRLDADNQRSKSNRSGMMFRNRFFSCHNVCGPNKRPWVIKVWCLPICMHAWALPSVLAMSVWVEFNVRNWWNGMRHTTSGNEG